MSIYPTLTVLIFLLLTLYFHRSIFHPVCLQSALWFCQLFGLWLLQDHFDQVSTSTLWLIVGGVIGFGSGGTIIPVLLNKSFNKVKPDETIAANDFTVLIMVAFIIMLYMINAVEPFTLSISYFSSLKDSFLSNDASTFGPIGTLVLLLNVYIITIYTCETENKFALPLAIMVSIVISVIVGAKGFLLLLASSLLYSGYYTKKIRFRQIGIGIIILVCFFAIITFVRTQDKTSDKDFYLYAFETYTLSAIPALDQQIHSSYSHDANNTLRTVYLWLNKIGFNFEIPPMLADFVFVPHVTNVFTYLYPYYIDFGYFGAILICFVLGGCHGYFHTKAVNGNVRHMIFASLLSYPLLMQFFDDQYFRWMSNWVYFMIVILLSTRTYNFNLLSTESNH
jgi:oligosaccharide repeat unit polymerase